MLSVWMNYSKLVAVDDDVTKEAANLAPAVIAEPSLTAKVTECSTKLQGAAAG